jgi:hypothetical protein
MCVHNSGKRPLGSPMGRLQDSIKIKSSGTNLQPDFLNTTQPT